MVCRTAGDLFDQNNRWNNLLWQIFHLLALFSPLSSRIWFPGISDIQYAPVGPDDLDRMALFTAIQCVGAFAIDCNDGLSIECQFCVYVLADAGNVHHVLDYDGPVSLAVSTRGTATPESLL